MAVQIVCPRCGARDSFMKGYLPETCVCRVCQSQLDWREILGCGPDCKAVEPDPAPEPSAPTYVASTITSSATAALAAAVRRLKGDAPKAAESTEAATPAEGTESAEIAEEEDTENEDATAAGEDRAARGRGDEEQ
jgi:hypothetical protein